MEKKKRKISTSFQLWLLLIVSVAFIGTSIFLWFYQTDTYEKSTENYLIGEINDVIGDISDTSDENLLVVTRAVATELNATANITEDVLNPMLEKYNVSEINYVDATGFIKVSTNSTLVDYNMSKSMESAAFLALLGAYDEYVQQYQPSPMVQNEYRKYAGVKLLAGGFVQVGYNNDRYYEAMADVVKSVVKNRRVGESGYLVVTTSDWQIVSDRDNNYGQPISIITAETQDFSKLESGKMFVEGIFIKGAFTRSFCLFEEVEGYKILAVYPEADAMSARNISVLITIIVEVVVFAALFTVIYLLVRKLVVKNIDKVNESLSAITAGNLDTVVDVRSQLEFDALSNDINATVDTLKRYIAEAAARIDEELAFAKAIQHSVLPSVFPPYPNRKDIAIHATMHTAKEVGGDFYDFYFVDDDHLGFLIADVSGKGIPAAMFMMTAKTVIKSFVESGMSVEEAFTFANAKLSEGNDAHMFVTAWMGVLNTKTGLVTFANAGHNPPVIKHADGTFEYFKSRPGFVLAGMEGIRYRKNELQLQKGDIIYLYTDGVTEAMNVNEELYGEDRLQKALNSNKDGDVVSICEEVKADVDLFVGEADQFDDITMVCLRYNGEEN